MIKFLSIILFSLFINSCGNQKPNKLPEGVVDKSQYPFPPSAVSYTHLTLPTKA